jgi:hypothetical protein
MVPAYPREAMQQRICAALEAGATLGRLAARPGWPSRQTVYRWSLDDPDFARRLQAARGWRRGLGVQAGPVFDEALASAFLLRVRRGEAVRQLVREPGLPNRDRLNRWKRERPDFAAELEAAARFSQTLRPPAWARFDEAASDVIVARVASGLSLPRVLADPDLPGETAVRRWRAREPDFDKALRTAHRAGHRRRMSRRVKLTPDLFEHILERLVAGASLLQVSRDPRMPHYVTLMAWRRRDPEFARMVAWGRDQGGVMRALEGPRPARLGGGPAKP